jgi:hypothetical protein
MVRWGGVEIAELDQIPLAPGSKAPVDEQHLLAFGTTLHRPTGLRLTPYQSDWNDRGMNREFYLTPPPPETWRIEVVVRDGHPLIRTRVRDHLGLTLNDDIPHDVEVDLSGRMLVDFGEVFDCFSAAPAWGEPGAVWTVERRDALVLMLFWALERYGRYNHHMFPTGPFPSTLKFQPDGVPEALHGTFRNPAWQRGQ